MRPSTSCARPPLPAGLPYAPGITAFRGGVSDAAVTFTGVPTASSYTVTAARVMTAVPGATTTTGPGETVLALPAGAWRIAVTPNNNNGAGATADTPTLTVGLPIALDEPTVTGGLGACTVSIK